MKNIKKVAALILSVLVILTAFTACGGKTPDKLIIGTWTDSTGMVSYDFKEDNTCVIKFEKFSIPSLGIEYTSDDKGTTAMYTITEFEDGTYNVKLSYTIVYTSVTKEYKFTVEENILTLTDISNGETTVLMAYTPEETSAPVDSSTAA